MRSNMYGTVSKALAKSIYATSAVKLQLENLMIDRHGKKNLII